MLSVWGSIGGTGTTGPANVYDASGQSITKMYNYDDNGTTREFVAELSADTTASPARPINTMNVGVYPSIVKAMALYSYWSQCTTTTVKP